MTTPSEDISRADINRRTVLSGIAWTTPVVMLAVAAPAAAASQPPPIDTNPCTNGTLTVTTLDKWQTGNGGDLWQALEIYNHTTTKLTVAGRVESSSAHLVGVDGTESWVGPKKNTATWETEIPPLGSVILSVRVEESSDNDACWLYIDACALRIHMKTIGKNDRIQ